MLFTVNSNISAVNDFCSVPRCNCPFSLASRPSHRAPKPRTLPGLPCPDARREGEVQSRTRAAAGAAGAAGASRVKYEASRVQVSGDEA